MDIVTGSVLHSARVIMALAFIAMLLFGGDLHAIFSKIGLVILTFTLWLCVCVPFSVWRGGSVQILREFWLLALFSFMIIAASVRGLEQCRKIMYALAAATMFIEAFTFVIGRAQGGRISMLGGTLGNANYLAMILLMGLPFCLFVLRTKPGLSFFKAVCLVMLLMIPVTVAATGSRGGLVTLALLFVLYFWPLPASHKVVAGVMALILAVIAVAWSSRSALDRFRTMFGSPTPLQLTESERSAMESTNVRKELLLSSLQLTMHHPLLGVGPGMFAVANANSFEASGRPSWNAWHETHNTFTQLSCEDGIPGLFFYCLTLFLCFKSLHTVDKEAHRHPSLASVRHMTYAIRLALIAFVGTAIFASNAYAYYFPMLAGLCVAVERATVEQLSTLMASGEVPASPAVPAGYGAGRIGMQPGTAPKRALTK